tara:strand:+ start:20 stop:124 length:105 start_codon:yes stop_codon:yes gene_type:complete
MAKDTLKKKKKNLENDVDLPPKPTRQKIVAVQTE